MPSLARVSLIEASPNRAGTAYVAAKNYLQDDRAPYIWKTDDYGKTWKKIIERHCAATTTSTRFARTPSGQACSTPGPSTVSTSRLTMATHWQSLSLNLPDTQVSDIAVAENDLVIATHGRAFYVLDDIAPLRQLSPSVMQTTEVNLYVPDGAVRRARPLSIDYALKSKADKVTIDILDTRGNVIRSFSAPEAKKPAAGDDEGYQTPRPVAGLEAGLNRFTWDLRYSGSTSFPGIILWGASVEEGPLAMPGSYAVRVTANGDSETQPFHIAEDPRSTVSQADLQAQFDLAMQVRDEVSAADQAVIDVRKIRDQVNDRLAKTQAAEVHSAGDTLNKKLTDVEEAIYQVKNRSGQDPLNFPIKLNDKIGHLLDVIEGWQDARPTDQTYTVFKQLSAELDVQLAKLKRAASADLAAFNKQLAANNLQSVTPK